MPAGSRRLHALYIAGARLMIELARSDRVNARAYLGLARDQISWAACVRVRAGY